MSDIATGSKVGALVCEALGLDPSRVSNLTMTVDPDNVVLVNVVMLTRVEHIEALGVVVADYKLVPRDDVAEVTSFADKTKRFDFFGPSPSKA